MKAERKQQPKAAGRFGYFHIGNLHSRKLAIWIPNRDVSEKVTPFKNGNFWYIMVYLCWISGVYQQFLWIPWGGFLSNCQVAPTVTTNASHQGGDTQLRLHGRWMDLATQAAEAPTQDTKKKLKLGEMMSRNGHVIYGTGTVTYGNFLLLFLLDFLYLLHLVLMFLFTFFVPVLFLFLILFLLWLNPKQFPWVYIKSLPLCSYPIQFLWYTQIYNLYTFRFTGSTMFWGSFHVRFGLYCWLVVVQWYCICTKKVQPHGFQV